MNEFDPAYLKRVIEKYEASRPVSLEEMLVGPDFFRLSTASNVQRAICRIIDGVPLGDLAGCPEVLASINCDPKLLPHGRPIEVDILSGTRCAKSLIAACTAVNWSQVCDLRMVGPGDFPRISIVSLAKDNAGVIFNYLLGHITESPRLSKLLVGDPGVDELFLRHPSGKRVQISVVAGSRAGGTLVSRWSAGVIFDEYTRMQGSGEATVNYDECKSAVTSRLLPRAQILSIGSPYAAFGPAHRRYRERFGKPQENAVVIWAPGWVMNTVYWTPDRCERFKVENPDDYITDCAAQFTTSEDSLFSNVEVDRAVREGMADLPWADGYEYVAAMDPATRGNGWTFVVATRRGNKRSVVYAREWVGTREEPLDPEWVMHEIALACAAYRVRTIWTDQAMSDALKSFARHYKISIVEKRLSGPHQLAAYTNLKMRFGASEVELPPDDTLIEDLKRVRKIIKSQGASIDLPETNDGRHCDYAPSVVLAFSRWLNDFNEPDLETEEKRVAREVLAMRRAQERRFGRR